MDNLYKWLATEVIMDDLNAEKIWESVMGVMRLAVSGATFNLYLKQTELLEIKEVEDRLVCEVGVGSVMIRDTVDQRFKGQLAMEMERLTGKRCEIGFRIESKSSFPKAVEGQNKFGPLFEETKKDESRWRMANLRPDYTFENYAVGGSNQMAYAASQAVSQKPGEAYNPLFVYGGVGVGKTHLMQAIGHVCAEKGEGKVLFCTSEQFTNDLVEGIKNKTTEKMRSKYRQLKLLMIDDVQFMAGRVAVQEEFFHTYNTLAASGGQIVMTSDRPPTEISKLEARLRSRFGAGLIVDIGQPDFELRTAILLIKARQKRIDLPMEAAQLIAEKIEGVRELEGTLVRLKTEAETKSRPLDKDLVIGLLKTNNGRPGMRKILTPNEVMNAVGDYFGVGVQLLKGERRTRSIVWPRQILMFLLRKDLELPQEEVGRLVGGRDHSTVIHATEKVEAAMKLDSKTDLVINDLRKRLLMNG